MRLNPLSFFISSSSLCRSHLDMSTTEPQLSHTAWWWWLANSQCAWSCSIFTICTMLFSRSAVSMRYIVAWSKRDCLILLRMSFVVNGVGDSASNFKTDTLPGVTRKPLSFRIVSGENTMLIVLSIQAFLAIATILHLFYTLWVIAKILR